jgi:hypothetical protein
VTPYEEVEKVSSAHRALTQTEDQAEVPILARCRPFLCHIIDISIKHDNRLFSHAL